MTRLQTNEALAPKAPFLKRLKNDIKRYYPLYALFIPVLLYYFIFYYKPMYGALIAFKDYEPTLGVMDSPWVSFYHFKTFFENPDFVRIFKNTILISGACILFGFPAPIILALLFNEIKNKKFKAVTQSIAYIPHFISLVVICGLIKTFVSQDGVIFNLVTALGGKSIGLLSRKEFFLPIYVISDIWQGVGWGSIIYLAAIAGIDQELYEAAEIDGAGKWKQTLHVTIPGIMPTIIIMFILRIGTLFALGADKVILLQNPLNYETSDIIASYVYRVGLTQQSWSYSSAVGLLNSALNFVIVLVANYICSKYSETSLW